MDPGQPGELFGCAHLRVEAPLLGHVAETAAAIAVDGQAIPGHGSTIECNEAEDRSHGCGLPGPVRSEEADDPARRRGEGCPIKCHDVAVALAEVLEAEHGCDGGPAHEVPQARTLGRRPASRYDRFVARLGILGLPNVGKTTLFNALTGLDAPTAAHPFSTTEPNIGVARVPDELLARAAEFEQSRKLTHATLDLLDLPAMARPGGSGLGAQFLGRLREMEALAAVLRAFEAEAVPADESGTDPLEQAETLLLELTLADAEVFDRRREKVVKEATADPAKKPEAAAIERAASVLEGGTPLRVESWTEAELAAFRDLAPLTLKPVVWVVNVDEGASGDGVEDALAGVVPTGDTVVVLSAEIEEEAARLDPEDRLELLEGLGLGAGALAKVVRATHDALGLVSFYTLSSKEAHAWTVPRGTAARPAAGKIHTDLERGFIRAEVADIHTVLEHGGWDGAKAAGTVRLEGRDYVVAEGDVLLIRFSV